MIALYLDKGVTVGTLNQELCDADIADESSKTPILDEKGPIHAMGNVFGLSLEKDFVILQLKRLCVI